MRIVTLILIIIMLSSGTVYGGLMLNLTKTCDVFDANYLEDVNYTYHLHNVGDEALHGLNLTDNRLGIIPLSLTDLDVGKWVNISVIHKINATDMPEGSLRNSAKATAYGPGPSNTLVTSNTANCSISLGFSGHIDVVKGRLNASSVKIGSVVGYRISVTNPLSNGITLRNLSITEDILYSPYPVVNTSIALDRSTLNPGETATGLYYYTVKHDDIQGRPGSNSPVGQFDIYNTVWVEAYPDWANSTALKSYGTRVVPASYTSSQVVKKFANLSEGVANTEITFRIFVNNTGDTLLNRTDLWDLLPAGLDYVSSNPSAFSSSNVNGTTTLYWSNLSQTLGILPVGGIYEVEVKAKISGSHLGTLLNKVASKSYNLRNESVTSKYDTPIAARKQNISVIKTADITSGSPGAVVNFTLTVNNTGNITLKNVFVSDKLPGGLTYDSSSAGSVNSGQDVYWPDIGPMSSGSMKSLWIRARIDGSVYGTMTNRVDVVGKPEHGDNVTDYATAIVQADEANIQVTKTAVPTFGSAGTLVNFTLNVTNNGMALLPNVFVSDKLPIGLTYDSSSAGSVNSGQDVYWPDIGPMSSGSMKSLWIRARIDGSVYGTMTNRVDVVGKPEHGDNVTDYATAIVQADEANIQVTKTASPTFGSAGTLVNFTLNVTNNGMALLPNVFVSDKLPIGLTYDSSSAGSVNSGQDVYWPDIGPMSSGSMKSLWIRARIDGSVYGTMTNRVDVVGKPEHGDNVTDYATAIVQADEANIQVTKTASPTFGSAGTLVNFTLNVTNNGMALLPNVFVSDKLPIGLTYDSSSAGSVNSGQDVYWPDIGPMSSGSMKSLWIRARIDGSVYGTMTNRVDVVGKPEHGDNVTDYATAIVQADEANIQVTKTASPTFGSAGTLVNFTLNVTNNGMALLPNVFVSDKLPIGLTYDSSSAGSVNSGQDVYWPDIGPMSSGSMKSLWIRARIDGSVYGTMTNRVDVVGKPEHGDNVTDYATAIVQADQANIQVTKTAVPTFGSAGTLVNFTLNVTNNGMALLPNVFVSDKLPIGLTYDSSSAGSVNSGQDVYWPDIGPMSSGSMKSLWIRARIDGSVYGTMTNRVDVVGKPEHGDNVTDYATAIVQADEANIQVTKTAVPTFGSAGTLVNFTLNVTNNGMALLPNVFVSDKLPIGLTYDSSSAGSVNSGQDVYWPDIGPMSSGSMKSLWIRARIDGSVYGTMTNRVDVVGKPEHGDNVTDYATAIVQADEANIQVTKTAVPTFGSAGTLVNFTLNVTNNGMALLPNVFVSDKLPIGLTYDSSSAGSVNSGQDVYWPDIGPMSSGSMKSLWIRARIDGSVYGTMTNRVDVVGKPEHGDNVTDYATAIVQADQANIQVTKTAVPTFGSAGTLVNFTLNVTNNGMALLPNVFVSDKLPIGLTYDSSSAGSVNSGQDVYWPDIGPMSSGSMKSLWIRARIDGSVYGTMTNRVDVVGKPEHGDNVTDYATAIVQADQANIQVTKTASPTFGSAGTLVNFTLNVTNNGMALLPNVFVSDKLPIGLTYDSSSAGSVNSGQDVYWPDIGPMSSGSMKSLWIRARIDGSVYGTMTNRVDVVGKPEHGDNVTDYATAIVQADQANIQVTKTAVPTFGSAGTLVNFTLNVTNNGMALLPNVFVSDKLPIGLTYDSSSAGSVNSGQDVYWPDIGPMSSGSMKSLWIRARIDGSVYGTMTNRVDVVGKPEHGDNVTDYATAIVQADQANIQVTKTAVPTFGSAGTLVNFTLNVTNNGMALLPNVFVSDKLPSGLTYDSSSAGSVNSGQDVYWPDIGPMSSGSMKSLWIRARIDGSVYGTMTNRVDVVGKPEHGDNVTDYATAIVQSDQARINVTKVADPTTASPGAEIRFVINILNNGNWHLDHVKAIDNLPLGMTYISDNRNGSVSASGKVISWNDLVDLDPSASAAINLLVRIDRNISGLLTNVVYVNAADPAGDEVNDSAKAEVLSLLPKIKVNKTLEPVQYGQYCEAKTISGVGIIESKTSIEDKTIALEYDDTLAGEGEIELESAAAMSEAAEKLQRDVPSLDPENQSSLNLFADTNLAFKGAKPLTGGKSIHSMAFYGGSGARIKDIFSAEEMEKEQTIYFSSTDKASSPQTIGTDLKSSFNGTIETDSKMHNMFGQDIKSQQLFSGVFNLDKVIKFHKNVTTDEPKMGCDGIDC